MTTINLHQNTNVEKEVFFHGIHKGVLYSLVSIILIILFFFGLKYYIPIIEARNIALDADILIKNKNLVGLKSLEQVVDMQNRLNEIKNNLQIQGDEVRRIENGTILDKLGQDLNRGVVVSSYNYNGDNVGVKFNANNFADAASQIANLKKSNYFTQVELGGISKSENKIVCEITMKIAKK